MAVLAAPVPTGDGFSPPGDSPGVVPVVPTLLSLEEIDSGVDTFPEDAADSPDNCRPSDAKVFPVTADSSSPTTGE